MVITNRAHKRDDNVDIAQLRRLGKPIVVTSFPRSGTHLMIDLIRRQFPACRASKRYGESVHRVYLNLDQLLSTHPNQITQKQALKICKRSDRPIIKSHAFPGFSEWQGQFDPWIQWLKEEGTFLYMVRDVREVLCSYHLLAREVDSTARCAFQKFLARDCSYFMPSDAVRSPPAKLWARHLTTWISARPSLFFYDQIVTDTEQSLSRLAAVVGEDCEWKRPLIPKRTLGLWDGRLARLFSRSPNSTAILTQSKRHRRQDPKREFTAEAESLVNESCAAVLDDLTRLRRKQVSETRAVVASVESSRSREQWGKLAPPIILLGTYRSGTTWLGTAFSQASDVAYWAEPRPVWVYGNWFQDDDILTEQHARPSVKRYIRGRFERFTRMSDKSRFCEKTPSNCMRIRFIRAVFPNARFILVVRDGRSVLSSAREILRKGGASWKRIWERCLESRPRELPAHLERISMFLSKFTHNTEQVAWGARPPGWRQWLRDDPNTVFLAKQWAGTINQALDDIQFVDESQKLIFKFEDLVQGDGALMEKIVEFSGIQDGQPVLDFVQSTVDPGRVSKWRSQIDDSTLQQIRPFLEPTLHRLGYRW